MPAKICPPITESKVSKIFLEKLSVYFANFGQNVPCFRSQMQTHIKACRVHSSEGTISSQRFQTINSDKLKQQKRCTTCRTYHNKTDMEEFTNFI